MFSQALVQFLILSSIICSSLVLAHDSFEISWKLPLPATLIAFNSTEGKKIFVDSVSSGPESNSFFQVFQHLTTQNTTTMCSIATSVTLLNAIVSDQAPVDPTYSPYAYWTQSNFMNECTDRIVNREVIWKMGVTMDQLGAVYAACYPFVQATMVHANTSTVEKFRGDVITSLSKGDQIGINFHRTELGESGGGHWSPLVAVSAARDMVLLADVARFKYPPAWVPIDALFNAMLTVDSDAAAYRGYMKLSRV